MQQQGLIPSINSILQLINLQNLATGTQTGPINVQGQKLFKKESDVGMLLTGIQSTETRCM